MELSQYGWGERQEILARETPQWRGGRILSQEKGLYRAVYAGGETPAALSGTLRFHARTARDLPAVGDFVLMDVEGGRGAIQKILPRSSLFVRKAAGTAREEQVVAANVDTVFICMALNNDFNLRRLERYLAVAWESGASPVVVLTKADLCEELAQRRAEVERVAMGAELVVTSAMEQGGFEQLLTYLRPGTTAAFLGSSGVGKSTLINRLLGEERLETGGLRNDDKGRHTTTHRELLALSNGGLVIDTPGMRELGLWDAEKGVERAFSDVQALFGSCRFPDCTHTREPGCAVRAAIETGELPAERWAAYQKLQVENEYARDAKSYVAAKEQKFKKIMQEYRKNPKR